MFMEKTRSLINWLLPPICVLCEYPAQDYHYFCDDCYQELPILPQKCKQCARFLRDSEMKCGYCLSNPPPFDLTHALFPYEFPIRQLIARLKFQHNLGIAKALGELMAGAVKNIWYVNKPLPDLIIPIPLHQGRLKERGFNQALEIARPLGNILKIPIDYQGIRREKSTAQQSSLKKTMRKQNISGAFSIIRDFQGLRIALVDDVVTTGFTVMECARVLKKNGAKTVEVWCCARNG